MNMQRFFPLFLVFLAGCSKPSEKIVVATAANVQYVMKEIKAEFEKETGKEIDIIVGSSGKLTTQIREGAPFDVFVSADTKYPQEIFKNGGSAEKPKIYALGTLVLWSKTIPKAELNVDSLADDKIKKIAIPNPETAPYGEAAIQVLKSKGIFEKIEKKLVFGESIAQTAQYITSGNVEAGFNALSIVLSPEMKDQGNYIIMNSTDYRPIEQAAILLNHSTDSPKKETSEQFYKFLYSTKSKNHPKKIRLQVNNIQSFSATPPAHSAQRRPLIQNSKLNPQPLWLTFKLATITSVILLVLALPLAYWLAFGKFKGRGIIESLIGMPLVLPPSVIGFYLLLAFSPSYWFGAWIESVFSLRLVFSFPGLVIASVLYSLPFMVYPIRAGLQSLPASLREASYTLGKNEWETFFKVLLPNCKPAILTAFVITFAHTVGEFGVVLMIGGNIPGVTKVASVAIYNEVEALNYGAANDYAMVLFAITFVILLLVYSVNNRLLRVRQPS